MGEQPAIRAEGLHKRFGAVPALAGADLQVPAGGVVAVLGPNGAGKTTLVRILSTLLPPDAGRAWVAGLDVVRQAAAVRQLIGLSGQYAAVDGYLTGAARRTARTYSGGMRRRLDVAAALVAAPPVLFLDEPTTGLDPRGRFGLWTLLGELAAEGTSLLLTTQYLEEADRLADTIVVIDAGRVIAAGTSEALKTRIGGDRLELQARPGDDPRPLAAALAGLGSGPAAVHAETGRVILPVTDGPGILPDVATRLAANNLRVADLALRRPSLDDVFLTLTGQPAATPSTADTTAAGRIR